VTVRPVAAPTRDRPSPREALAAAAGALIVGAVLAWTTGPVAAARGSGETAQPPLVAAPVRPVDATIDPFAAVASNGPAWIVTPRAARPGEVVHVRLKYTPTFDPAGEPIVPQVLFAFLNDLRDPVAGQLYPAQGTFGVDLLVPPGTDWGADPIVWATGQRGTTFVPSRFLIVASRNAVIPFVATRSAQPPLWNR